MSEEGDVEFRDPSPSERISIRQFDHLRMLNKDGFLKKRTFVNLIVRAYYHQLSVGCNNSFCENKNYGLINNKKLGELSIQMTREYFQTGKHNFCNNVNPVFPLASVEGTTGIQLSTLKEALAAGDTLKQYTYFQNLIDKVFTYPDCLDFSFISNYNIVDGHDFSRDPLLNFVEVVETYKFLLNLSSNSQYPFSKLKSSLINQIKQLSLRIMKESSSYTDFPQVRKIIILLLFPDLMNLDQTISGHLLRGLLHLPRNIRDEIVNWFTVFPLNHLVKLLTILQHYITMRIYVHQTVDEEVAYAVRVMGLVHQGNQKRSFGDQIPYGRFYNDAVNNVVDFKIDFRRWISSTNDIRVETFESFSFCNFPFILDPAAKSRVLHIHAVSQQNHEVRNSVLNALLGVPLGEGGDPLGRDRDPVHCVIPVNRNQLIQSSLIAIERKKPRELLRPLRIRFEGEEGVDEGGVRKEFFQLILKKLFSRDYGMFSVMEEGTQYWFDLNSQDYSEFKLIGLLIGLAIYNRVILDLHFPMVIYKKLLGLPMTLEDLSELDPDLGRGLKNLREFDGNVEETYCKNFVVMYRGYDSTLIKHELIPNGENMMVTNQNREDYIQKLVKWKLVDSIKKPFEFFQRGFRMVVAQMCLKLFRPQELELLVCGSPKLDFDELERGSKYGEGYTKNSPVIKELWKIVKLFDMDMKKKFLSFCTGSDRVPIKGLGNLNLIIVRNGDDPNRLPTAHTCYNVLLLPEYKNSQILGKNLLTAIRHGFVGFGLQ